MKLSKTILKKGYYWEYDSLYEKLPEELEVPEYYCYTIKKNMLEGEIISNFYPKPFTREQAFAVAAGIIKRNKKVTGLIFSEDLVLYVCRHDGEWELNVFNLARDHVWSAEYERVLFLPQPATTPKKIVKNGGLLE